MFVGFFFLPLCESSRAEKLQVYNYNMEQSTAVESS